MLEWPSWSAIVFSSSPARSISVAAPWRRSCNRTGGRPLSTWSVRQSQKQRQPKAVTGHAGGHYLSMSKKEPIEAAVEFYPNARREEMPADMRELLSQLDGSRAARVAVLAA